MRVLVACEFSGVVRDAFRRLGHDAWSCDLLPSTAPSNYHIKGDVVPILGEGWDLMIAHPPCTYLCSSGLHWNKRRPERAKDTEAALDFVRTLMAAPIPRIAIENPVGCISTRIRPFDQKIQPWQFGHDASKGTCLWLTNLPPLKHGVVIPPHGYSRVMVPNLMPQCEGCGEPFCERHGQHFAECECIGATQDGVHCRFVEGYLFGTRIVPPPRPVWANQTPSGQNKLGPSADRWAKRSITYQGIADAMAAQWGAEVPA